MMFPRRRKKEFEYAQNGRLRNKIVQIQKQRLKRAIYQTAFKHSPHITFISMVTLLFLSPIMNPPYGYLFLLKGFIFILVELSTHILEH